MESKLKCIFSPTHFLFIIHKALALYIGEYYVYRHTLKDMVCAMLQD